MRLLPLASFIALMSHLISVSAVYKYICPSKTKFTTLEMGNLREKISSPRLVSILKIFKVKEFLPTPLTERLLMAVIAYKYLLTLNYITKMIKVYEIGGDRTSNCELKYVLD
ncbi:putative effector protein [Blumeria hordei DH14]|uniref:Putative effector protein n=1 Tax=Blumeria graminis f. sp. hordei (strain DH14) TaxID=546991 RepID=N1JBQ7_BLUG1|nr:putative effector protein [Blumeria hordei DH14]